MHVEQLQRFKEHVGHGTLDDLARCGRVLVLYVIIQSTHNVVLVVGQHGRRVRDIDLWSCKGLFLDNGHERQHRVISGDLLLLANNTIQCIKSRRDKLTSTQKQQKKCLIIFSSSFNPDFSSHVFLISSLPAHIVLNQHLRIELLKSLSPNCPAYY